MSRLTIYGGSGRWRWTLRASNGRVIGASTEAFRDRNKCIANVAMVLGVVSLVIQQGYVITRLVGDPIGVEVEGKR